MDYIIDAKNKKLGRVASEVAFILQGKKNAVFDPRLAGSDMVIVNNVKNIVFTGKKYEQKKYYRHTGYIGHLKEKTLKEIFEVNPAKVLFMAIENMLPKNALRVKRLKRLTINN